MNSTYTQLINNLEYLKMKQMITHLDEVIDFTTKIIYLLLMLLLNLQLMKLTVKKQI